MADRKISDLTALTTPASGDYLPIVDISEAAAASKNKRITIEELFRGVPLGTAAAPSIAIEGNENTGVYSPGANQLAVATNGTGRVFIDADGRLLVNLTSSSSRFHVKETNTNTIVGVLEGSGTYAYQSLQASGTTAGAVRVGANANDFVINAGASERLRITSAGRVGIGTSAPENTLGFAQGTGGIRFQGWNNDRTIIEHVNTAFPTYFQRIQVDAASRQIRIDSSSGDGGSSGSIALRTGATGSPIARLFVTGSGNVGIGTSAPGSVLDVRFPTSPTANNGTGINALRVFTTASLAANAGGAIALGGESTAAGGVYASYGQIAGRKENATSDNYAGYLQFAVNGSGGTMSERLRITSGGNVGIGTTSPGFTLDVNGNPGFGTTGGVNRCLIKRAFDGTANSYIGYLSTNSTDFAVKNGSGAGDVILEGNAGNIRFNTASSTERARIDSSGRLLIGTSTSVTAGSVTASTLQVSQGATGVGATLYSVANGVGPGGVLVLGHGRATSAGLLSSGDIVGQVRFAGGDGGDLESLAALIGVEVDGTPSANDMPGRLVFSTTADGSASPTERMRLNSSGQLLVGTSTAVAGADIQATTSLSIGGLVKREFSKELSLADAVATTYLTIAVPSSSFFTSRTNIGGEISYVIESSRQTSSRANKSVYGKVYFSISRFWESDANNPIFANLVSTDQSLSIAGSGADPTITWAASTDAGTDNATKNVYITITVNNPHAGTTGTSITGTVTYHTRLASVGDVTVS